MKETNKTKQTNKQNKKQTTKTKTNKQTNKLQHYSRTQVRLPSNCPFHSLHTVK
jgi:hypothetical protein